MQNIQISDLFANFQKTAIDKQNWCPGIPKISQMAGFMMLFHHILQNKIFENVSQKSDNLCVQALLKDFQVMLKRHHNPDYRLCCPELSLGLKKFARHETTFPCFLHVLGIS